MEFSHEEKVACLFTLGRLAESDGPKTREEIRLLSQLTTNKFGVSVDELLAGIIEESSMLCNKEKATQTLYVMHNSKKQILEDALSELMKIDEINDFKLGAWWDAQISYNLPEWQKRQKSSKE